MSGETVCFVSVSPGDPYTPGMLVCGHPLPCPDHPLVDESPGFRARLEQENAKVRRLDSSYSWNVEYTRKDPDKGYNLNRSTTVICERIDTAIAEVYKRWPEAVIIKAFRATSWGNDGLIVVGEPTPPGPRPTRPSPQ